MASSHSSHSQSLPTDFWSNSKTRLIAELDSNEHHGLSQAEARFRLERYGYNELHQAKRLSNSKLLLRQFNTPFVYILAVAAVISLYERQMTEALVIVTVLVVNTIIGFVDEFR